ncbi:TetR/AcrR family transcriptional regulator [Amycolatopsis regifaucium]|uniref:TetR family transcriptional regulator n=1 Tax=Amycolatopsis regifaucium TaxID=546365 RepID=A0A154M5B9_9PSEU|nr:TetR/AcrR family transcriptional regulator [Amycolatopsis regifaucium]KZB79792.1 TetR family transcriptional regulator [Amycolatopsis regifaucium]OKA09891.1 TetR family transcriptional regulator [Amycolatopsis regifaucium]SFI70867.1 DNA-binding transcriptional regulator, AcrR family [Amycolatopsis regifaucium]
MGRPPRHNADDFLDAAVRIFAADGIAAVTMSAVAREVGAPSGSIYHRFPGRPALLAAVWLRTLTRFQQDYLAVLEREPAIEAAVEAAAQVVRWCRAHPGEGKLLYAGDRSLGIDDWTAEDRARADEANRRLTAVMTKVVRRLRPLTGRSTDELMLALVDLPYAAVRRYLDRGEAPPPRAVDLVTKTTRTLLGAE